MRATITIHSDRGDQRWHLAEMTEHRWRLMPLVKPHWGEGDPAPDQYIELGLLVEVLSWMLNQPAEDGIAQELILELPEGLW